jgi:hypothetical protein
MIAILIILAVIGLLALIALAVGALSEQSAAPPEPDLAAPYREGLHAAVRLQRSAQDLEQQIWAEAARHADAETSVVEEGER